MSQSTVTKVQAKASITRDSALALAVAARDAATKIGLNLAIAVTDEGGHLIAFERADATPFLAAEVAVNKAWTAASFGLDTLIWNQVVAQPATAPLANHPRVMPVGGGVPIVVGGRVVGGIGISGGNAQQDHDVAVAALKAAGFELAN
ncbi:GlcG/HbpS family heme-binding protein [Rugamonas apoptosis]|uniref:Heme-binding protein n=1 Tax=Rugamonas apoptosis TaxID=2758570 RepID=A0A7W2FF38_9BURK|nr:heme-binding protein [Rugamonas apoptosis]MBA5690562.1 heme-binding protein [Rugamonas apoptosis]